MSTLKRCVLYATLLCAVVAITALFTIRVPAGQPGLAPAGNGDTNGDGVIDVSDAVHLLVYLFRQGDPPAAIAQGSPILDEKVAQIESHLAQLVESQNRSNDALLTIADAVTELRLEGLAQPCEERPDRFVANGDRTATDTCTGLMWQRATLGGGAGDIDGDGNALSDGDRLTWDAANEYVANLDLGGHTDWRLPTSNELEEVMRLEPALLYFVPYRNQVPGHHWTSTIDSFSGSRRAAHFFNVNGVFSRSSVDTRGGEAWVIAVRDSQ